MPVNRQAVLQLSLLLLAVPAQYLVTRHFVSSPDSSSRNLAFRRLVYHYHFISMPVSVDVAGIRVGATSFHAGHLGIQVRSEYLSHPSQSNFANYYMAH